jgi:hypothetical protein
MTRQLFKKISINFCFNFKMISTQTSCYSAREEPLPPVSRSWKPLNSSLHCSDFWWLCMTFSNTLLSNFVHRTCTTFKKPVLLLSSGDRGQEMHLPWWIPSERVHLPWWIPSERAAVGHYAQWPSEDFSEAQNFIMGLSQNTSRTCGLPRNFVRGVGGFNKFSWEQRAERTGIWGR